MLLMVVVAASVPNAISSFPPVSMDLGGRSAGQAPSITAGQPIMLTDTSVQNKPWLLIVPTTMPMFMWKAENGQ